MKRILESSGRRPKIAFDIQLDQQKYYFRGDEVRGTVLLESPKPIKIKNIRLQWYGRVRVQLEPGLRDERELFRETAYLDIPASENESDLSRREAIKRAATATTTLSLMIPTSPSKGTWSVDPDKLHTYPFAFLVPENPILPSCTEVHCLFSFLLLGKKSSERRGDWRGDSEKQRLHRVRQAWAVS
ncbi:hypothetical protein BJV82DRAFT_191185 [Fennellomyces sp. T-0311]|nr:hypothetical protein BJV82DRAFT_191185 [Fennellomyces sp. T-0311]